MEKSQGRHIGKNHIPQPSFLVENHAFCSWVSCITWAKQNFHGLGGFEEVKKMGRFQLNKMPKGHPKNSPTTKLTNQLSSLEMNSLLASQVPMHLKV